MFQVSPVFSGKFISLAGSIKSWVDQINYSNFKFDWFTSTLIQKNIDPRWITRLTCD
jgi:hypothetical protein